MTGTMARVKIDLTVAAIPAFVGAMIAEHAWQRAHPVEPGTRAGDYQLADTVASLSMGIGSLAAPYVARRLLDPVTPGVGRHGRTLLALGAAAAVLTTVGDVVRRRVRDGSLPEPQTVPAAVREVQDELADIRLGPAVAREDRPAVAPALRRTHGALAVSAVASTALVTSTTWAAMTAGKRLFARSPLDLGAGPWAASANGRATIATTDTTTRTTRKNDPGAHRPRPHCTLNTTAANSITHITSPDGTSALCPSNTTVSN